MLWILLAHLLGTYHVPFAGEALYVKILLNPHDYKESSNFSIL